MRRLLPLAVPAALISLAVMAGLAPSSPPENARQSARSGPGALAGLVGTGDPTGSVDDAVALAFRAEEDRLEAERLEAIRAEEDRARREREAMAAAAVRPSVPPIQRPVAAPSGCGYEALIRATWPADQGDKAIAVAMRESGCTNTARNPSGASGLFQLMLPMHAQIFEAVGCSADQWADANCNVRAAFALWQGSGWAPWGG